MLAGKNIIIGVTGGIASYKTLDLASRLRKAGAKLTVVMTKAAQQFIAPAAFAAVGDCSVFTDRSDFKGEVGHIALANQADLMVIAPLTANTAAKIAAGLADNLLTAVLLAIKAPVLLAPAMNVNMWQNAVVQKNMLLLQERGFKMIEPSSGFLACGTSGQGRMAEAEELFREISRLFEQKGDLKGRTILVTAGPTREALDPVRFLSNKSSGKMGYAIAEAVINRGGRALLVSGPVNLLPPKGVEMIPVETAVDMYRAVLDRFESADIVIKAAAVSDYRPADTQPQKIKKSGDQLTLELVKNPDILLELGRRKRQQVLVGFAAETENIMEYARRKLEEKNLDLIVANDVSRSDAGFSADKNQVILIDRNERVRELPLMTKAQVAHRILDAVLEIAGSNDLQ